MKRKTSQREKLVRYNKYPTSSTLLPKNFVSYNEHFSGIYSTLLNNSLENILSLIKPGIAYKGIPLGLVLLDFEYDKNNFYVNARSLIYSQSDISFDKSISQSSGFYDIFSAMPYFLNGIAYREGQAELLNWDSLTDIKGSFNQLFDGLSQNRPPLSKTYYFYYGDVEFSYTIASKDEAKSRYNQDMSSIKLMGENHYGYGGSFGLDHYTCDDYDVKIWNNYLHNEGYLIEKRVYTGFLN